MFGQDFTDLTADSSGAASIRLMESESCIVISALINIRSVSVVEQCIPISLATAIPMALKLWMPSPTLRYGCGRIINCMA